ncbi:hypothetical protein MP638_004301 [Amoeboaphelidium occidentale]|nr:hypothetical protein MP638_004301 [Amoeboaphelidium occidentale]
MSDQQEQQQQQLEQLREQEFHRQQQLQQLQAKVQKVFYLLVQPDNTPFMNSTIDAVLIPVNADLSNVDSSNMRVYKKRADATMELVEVDAIVADLGDGAGKTLANALLVVVLMPGFQGLPVIQLRPIDPGLLKSPVEVQLPVGWDTISFIGPDKWRENIVEEISKRLWESDVVTDRIPPMAFVRCSRGGKTRALLEIASMLKAQSPGLAVIYVSFNNATEVDASETDGLAALRKTRALKEIASMLKAQSPGLAVIYVSFNNWTNLKYSETDGLAALRRRIAYYSLKEAPRNNDAFEDYRKMEFSESDLLNWLGDNECVLFVDELNLLGDRLNSEFAHFIKSRFLARKGRYFVFSSHKATTAVDLSNFMESQSNRGVLTPGLPLVTNVQKARDSLHWQSMSARDLIIYGGIPGLLVEAHKNGPPSLKRNELIKSFIQSNNVNMGVIRVILGTFFTGDYKVLPPQLLELMDVTPEKPLKVKWIPFHLMELMKDWGYLMSLPLSTRHALSEVETLFISLATSKEKSREAWEALFVVVLLIRCLSGKVNSALLPLHGMNDASVSYNYLMDSSKTSWLDVTNKSREAWEALFVVVLLIRCLSGKVNSALLPLHGINDASVSYNYLMDSSKTSWLDVTNVNDLLSMIPKRLENDKCPHIAVYYPPHSKFELYDVFVVPFNASGERGRIIGYQLKEGKKKPDKGPSKLVDVSIVIRGDTIDGSSTRKGWRIASEEEINEFFGENARLWTPKHWIEYSKVWFEN